MGRRCRERPSPGLCVQIGRTRTNSYLADLNVWLALSWNRHPHSATAWNWFDSLNDAEVLFYRFTQVGILRLLTTRGVMQGDCLTVRQAWDVYDRWLGDPRVGFRQEVSGVGDCFRKATQPFLRTSSPKILGDCYLVAISQASQARLVTFDRGLVQLCNKVCQDAVLLA